MGRKNRDPHAARIKNRDRFDLAYVHLPEYPQYIHIVSKPAKTVYVNLDADFDTDADYMVKTVDDPIIQLISGRIGVMV